MSGQKTVTTRYSYFANLAVGLCEGEIACIRRIWADGREIDQVGLTIRVHTGGPDQEPDPLIVAKEGAETTPAYRGLAYVVFEGLPLADFGNRIPQFAFEVIRPINGLYGRIRAVEMIPGASEFGLDPDLVTVDLGLGRTEAANRHQLQRATDVLASLDALQALCPNLRRVAVVATWFGTDLRAGSCRVVPKVEARHKQALPADWRVAGITRADAEVVSILPDGNPAYGGTPSDDGLTRLVAELVRRGLEVLLYPFVMMDVPAGNGLPDPRVPGATQPPFPWRGRITCDPAPGLPGSPDGTSVADAQVAAFYANGYDAEILHYADLAARWAQAGVPIAGFVIGSEYVGLTRVRGAAGYPAVQAFRAIAAAVRARLGPGVALVYGADWTEYGAHVLDGGATIRFPLDDLFADPNIAAVGIDWYAPVSDWRDTPDHADLAAAGDIYDRAYLKERGGSGEAFDWYYPDGAARAAQDRVPITDGAIGKAWIYRVKDLVAWWSNPHVERDGGVETRATAWVPMGKPIWLTELGVPAVDKGTNGPNVFPDPKSVENAFPPESRALRDELIQLRGLEAAIARFDPAVPGFREADNPVSPVYGGRMVDPAGIFIWAWDAPALSGLPDRARGLGRYRQLAGRPLDHRADRGLRPRPACPENPGRFRLRRPGRNRGGGLSRRLRARPAALGAGRPGNLGTSLRARRLGGGGPVAPARAAPGPAIGAGRGRPGPALRGEAGAPSGPGRGERPAALGRARPHRIREPGLPPRHGVGRPARGRAATRDPDRGRDRHPAPDRRRPRRGHARPDHRGPRQRGLHVEPAPGRAGARRPPGGSGGRAGRHGAAQDRPDRRRPHRTTNRGERRPAPGRGRGAACRAAWR